MLQARRAYCVPRVARVVSLDVMNTLIAPKENPMIVYSREAYKHGIVCEQEHLLSAFHKSMSFYSGKYPCFGFGNITAQKWWHYVIKDSIAKATNERIPDDTMENISHNLYELYKDPSVWRIVDEEVIPFLTNLRRKGLSLVITSNFDIRLRNLLKDMNVIELFDMVLISGELGIEKPDPRIFNLILKHFKLDSPSELLHIGDNLRKDYLGAKDIGAKAILFDPLLKDSSIDLSNKITTFQNLDLY
ncbi:unnamed protein product [Auanema sp. JU1783]|nr:unnamed protein product [Auanema sp. JU1783]